jgi:hypothetical protein
MNSLARRINIRRLGYPTISRNMWEIFDHWFLVAGNGYEWKNGELVSDLDERTTKATIQVDAGQRAKWTDEEETEYRREKFLSDGEFEEPEELVNSYLQSAIEEPKFNPKTDFYPISQYSKCMTAPPDLKPEWRRALIGFLLALVKLSETDLTGVPAEQMQIKWAKKALMRLAHVCSQPGCAEFDLCRWKGNKMLK